MPIEEIEAWKYGGRIFTDRAKAEEFAEELVGAQIKQELLDKGFTLSQWVKIVETILSNRKQLASLLDF